MRISSAFCLFTTLSTTRSPRHWSRIFFHKIFPRHTNLISVSSVSGKGRAPEKQNSCVLLLPCHPQQDHCFRCCLLGPSGFRFPRFCALQWVSDFGLTWFSPLAPYKGKLVDKTRINWIKYQSGPFTTERKWERVRRLRSRLTNTPNKQNINGKQMCFYGLN